MTDPIDAQTVALFRYGLIAEFLHLPHNQPGLYQRLRVKASQDYQIPGSQRQRVAAETLAPLDQGLQARRHRRPQAQAAQRPRPRALAAPATGRSAALAQVGAAPPVGGAIDRRTHAATHPGNRPGNRAAGLAPSASTVPLAAPRRPDGDGALLVKAAFAGLRGIYKSGFRHAEAGVILVELQEQEIRQAALDFEADGQAGMQRQRVGRQLTARLRSQAICKGKGVGLRA